MNPYIEGCLIGCVTLLVFVLAYALLGGVLC